VRRSGEREGQDLEIKSVLGAGMNINKQCSALNCVRSKLLEINSLNDPT
jgi:hypothetical protein